VDATNRGVLYPARLPTLTRLSPPDDLADRVRWFWIPEWDIAPGRSSRQQLIAFAASNLVVERGRVQVSGPTTRRSYVDLTGHGWAVGVLLRPAAVPAFTADPGALRDDAILLDETDLPIGLSSIMERDDLPERRHDEAIALTSAWLRQHVPPADAEGRSANDLAELLEQDASVVAVTDAARRLHTSVRTLQRLSARFVGLPPAALIRRRRLQEAAERLRANPTTDIAGVAAELGYADHAHLVRDFRTVLGFTPSAYRSDAVGR